MAENSKIEWTDHTLNLWWGCTKVHAGCDNCYAEELSDIRKRGTHKTGLDKLWGERIPRKRVKSAFGNLAKWQARAQKNNVFEKVFVGSMMDIFEKSKPTIEPSGEPSTMGCHSVRCETHDIRWRLFQEISKGYYPNLIFLFLTKRPSNIHKYIPNEWFQKPPKNVWFGCSPVNQKTYNNYLTQFLNLKELGIENLFYSVEPQLDEIILWADDPAKWVIQGGESGKNRRPFNLDWATILKNNCAFLEIPYFFKQIDNVQEIPEQYLIREFPKF